MIFLTVGNWHSGFDRLIEAVDKLKEAGIISEPVIAQIGLGKYKPRNFYFVDFYSPQDFVTTVAKARLIISHAGIGTIAQAINQCKPVIVVPRKASLGEHVHDHQYTSAKQLERQGKVLVAYEIAELADKLRQARGFIPAKQQGSQKIVEAIEVFLEKLAAKKILRSRQ